MSVSFCSGLSSDEGGFSIIEEGIAGSFSEFRYLGEFRKGEKVNP